MTSLFFLLATVCILGAPIGAQIVDTYLHGFFPQVAIRVQQPIADKIEDYHLCNGVIVDAYFVATTVRCLELRPTTNDSTVYVTGGFLKNNGTTTSQMNFTIEATFLHPKSYHGQHDIALIKVEQPLINGGVLQMHEIQDSTAHCSVIVRSYDQDDYFKVERNIMVVPSEGYCNFASPSLAVDLDDDDYLCSEYPLDSNWCSLTKNDTRDSPDLGSALICNNKYVGLLSQIEFPYDKIRFPCNQPRKTYATFVSLDEHRTWMYQVMGKQPPKEDDDHDNDDNSANVQQTMGVMMIAAAVFIYWFF